MTGGSVLPHGEALRRAVLWLAQQQRHDPAILEQAAQRFDLSPLEAEFLLQHFGIRRQAADAADDAGR
jgi:hypothetical protein